ncbi:MAG: energy transducer TonB [Gemmatimonadetes bacterium]|nr:energy transducer TonB [Gemmatimonadota bacterium]MCZ6824637.1 energy transducer TonB [Gemmatimonadota bacterium]
MSSAVLGASAVGVLLTLATGCSETIRPALGGLVIGERGDAFHMPTLLNERLPFEYPTDAWRDRIGGETVLRLRISSDGIVDSITVERSSGHRSLDSAAVAGATELRYKPARQGEHPVPVWATLPIRYPMPERSDQP